jgi:ribosomal protein S15P/S13E
VLLALYAEFGRRYALSVLFPPVSDHQTLSTMIRGIFEKITRKMTLGDAQILWIAEQYSEVERIISWNTKDFSGRTSLRLMTPQQWLEEQRTDPRTSS